MIIVNAIISNIRFCIGSGLYKAQVWLRFGDSGLLKAENWYQ